MRVYLLVLACLCSACAAALPPHVWMPVKAVEAVDYFWWTNEQLCQVRVIWWDSAGMPRGQTMTVDSAICLERLKGRGYDISGVKGQP